MGSCDSRGPYTPQKYARSAPRTPPDARGLGPAQGAPSGRDAHLVEACFFHFKKIAKGKLKGAGVVSTMGNKEG
jgi:hypothetical protein